MPRAKPLHWGTALTPSTVDDALGSFIKVDLGVQHPRKTDFAKGLLDPDVHGIR